MTMRKRNPMEPAEEEESHINNPPPESDHHHPNSMAPMSSCVVLEQTPSINVTHHHDCYSNIISSSASASASASAATTTTTHHHQYQVAAGMEDYLYADIFDVLSNVELHPNFPTTTQQPFILSSNNNSSSSSSRHVVKPQNLDKGTESSHDPKANPNHVQLITQCDGDENPRDSKRSRVGHQPGRSRSSELHNMSERIRRDRIRRKMKALQDLIPNCNTRDKASILDDAIRYIKALQNQLKIMSTGAGSIIQNPNMLPAGYQMVPVPQFRPQFMPMSPGIGMGMGLFNLPPTTVPVIPFALPTPGQSTLPASGMTMVEPMPQLQLPLSPFQSVAPADCTSMVAPGFFRSFPSTVVCTTHGESSSQNVPRTFGFSQVSTVCQGTVTPMVLPSQIIMPASSSSISVVTDVPEIPEEDYDSESSQRI